jgi:hypothetical protein
MRFAQYAEEAPSRIVLDEAAEPVLRQAARPGDPRYLEQGGSDRKFNLELASNARNAKLSLAAFRLIA